MREICKSGSEGGAGQTNVPFLPLSATCVQSLVSLMEERWCGRPFGDKGWLWLKFGSGKDADPPEVHALPRVFCRGCL